MKKKDQIVLNISKNSKNIIEMIDNEKFLGLNNPETSRTDLFLFAMALGLETDITTPLLNKEGLSRTSYLTIKDEALLYSTFINKMENKNNLEECTEKNKVFELAEEYANTGFELIKNMMDTKSEQINMLEMIKELDDKYDEIYKEE
ncbi:MAG: hypothetical protein E7E15_08120 [Terrisporobacter othiniensis]|uniref:hypothetical protein n=1 Tax=Terrisporobacter othiniensis TaxID=1577792 RepID=UPI002904227D|nr:hypothetical protein [Terrisporobacter othiniensis]MDU2201018.1 hypothetical protein [Terrisporobacter othiniensis]